jgi:hypothetical protein
MSGRNPTLVLAAIVVGACGMPRSVPADNTAADASATLAARRTAAHRQRRVIFNDDGAYATFPTTAVAYLDRLRRNVGTQVDSAFCCTGVTGVVTHRTKVGDQVSDLLAADSPAWVLDWANGIRGIQQSGRDTLELGVAFCHGNGLEVFYSHRMNDIHDSVGPDFMVLSRFKREHPDCLLGKREDAKLYPYPTGGLKTFWSALNYERPEVHDYVFRMIQDVCERYDVDGIELDWVRFPLLFAETREGRPVEDRQCQMVTGLVRRIRRMTEEVAQRRGRPLLVALRCPLSLEYTKAVGLDVEAWLGDDLVDLVTAGGGDGSRVLAPQVQAWTGLAHRYGVPLYGCICWASAADDRDTIEAWRASASNIWYAGADGVYSFNYFFQDQLAKPDRRLSEIGSPQTLEGLDALFVSDSGPLALRPGIKATAGLVVGEDVVAAVAKGKAAHTSLRLHVPGLGAADRLRVSLNGRLAAPPVAAKPFAANEPNGDWYECTVDPAAVRRGDNTVEVSLAGDATAAGIPADRLELLVRYP